MNLTPLQQLIIDNRKSKHSIDLSQHHKLDFHGEMYKLSDMKEAGELIAKHVRVKAHIAHVHDYDCDGINSGVVLYKGFTKQLGHDNNTMFCNKRKDGNGINDILFERIATVHKVNKIDLIVMADHGSSDERNISRLVALGIEVCLTDHHTIPPDDYPKSATVFVNPERADNEIYLPISGCFVAFLVVVSAYEALRGSIDDIEVFNDLLPFVAITTISDVMALNIPMNRAVCEVGFNEMNSLRNKLWLTFKKMFSINTTLDHVSVGFVIGPLINTGNRVGQEDLAYSVLISEDMETSTILIKEMIKFSNYRKKEQKKLFVEAELQLVDSPYHNCAVLVLETELAIGGVIAGQICEAYSRPTVCFIDDGSGILGGSARLSTPGLNIRDIFETIAAIDKDIFIRFGGHKQAAGCTIHKNKIDDFRRLLNEQIPVNDIKPVIHIDKTLKASEITPSLVHEMDLFKPYGKEFDRPIFKTRLKLKYIMQFGNIVKFIFKDDTRDIEGIYFPNSFSTFDNKFPKEYFERDESLDVVFGLEFSNFAGSTTIQLKVIDVIKL